MNDKTQEMLRSLAEKEATIDDLNNKIDDLRGDIKRIMKKVENIYPRVPKKAVVKVGDKYRVLVFGDDRRYVKESFDIEVVHER